MTICSDCAAKPGALHADGCDVEQCCWCGMQRIGCCCEETEGERRIPWTGEWPGVAECRAFGWFARWTGNGFEPCAADAPGAREDLNRLHSSYEVRWDQEAQVFRLREPPNPA